MLKWAPWDLKFEKKMSWYWNIKTNKYIFQLLWIVNILKEKAPK